MDFYYADHSFDIFCFSTHQERKGAGLLLDKSADLVTFLCQDPCSKRMDLVNSIACQYLLLDKSRKRIKDTTTSDNIVGFKKRHRKNNQFFYRYISKNTVTGPKNSRSR